MASGQCAPHQQVEHMAAPTSLAETFKSTLANGEPSTHGELQSLQVQALNGHFDPKRTIISVKNRWLHRGSSSYISGEFTPVH